MRWGYQETYPRPCVFCQHEQLGNGVCKCGPDCPTCWSGHCCGQINTVALATLQGQPARAQ